MQKYKSPFEAEGGEDADGEAPQAKSRTDKKLEKYADAMENFSVKNSGCTDDIPMNRDRSCQDILCLFVFLIFLGAMLGCTIYGSTNGDVQKMMAPYDYQNRFCGIDALADYEKLYFTKVVADESQDPIKVLFQNAVCVKKCPRQAGAAIECADNDSKCQGIETKKTMGLLNYCVPLGLTDEEKSMFNEGFYAMLDNNVFGQQLIAMYNCSTALSLSLVTAFLLSLLYLFAISKFGEHLAWCIIWLVGIGLIAATGCAFVARFSPTTFGVTSMSPGFLLCLAIVLMIVTLVFFCMLWCSYDQLKTAIDVVDAAADFLNGTKRLIAVSFGFFIVTAIVILVWIFAVTCILSMGVITPAPNQMAGYIPQFRTYTMEGGEKSQTFYLVLFMLFGLFWIVNFIAYKTGCITMIAASTYYFNSHAGAEGEAEVGYAVKAVYAYHLGTIAMASFIIAVINFIQFLFEVAAEKAASASGENAAVKCVICCGRCLLKCLECIADYINQAAFSFVAISGENFCKGCYNGLMLNLKYGLEFAWAQTLAMGFVKLGKIAIVIANTGIAYLLMKYVTKDLEGEFANVLTPLVVVAIVTYITTDIFLGQFDEAVQALMTCLGVDKDLNGPESTKWGPPTFHDRIKGAQDKIAARNASKGTGYVQMSNTEMN